MKKRTFILNFEDIEIGSVSQQSSEFPWVNGTVNYTDSFEKISSSTVKLIKDYRRHTNIIDQLLSVSENEDVEDELNRLYESEGKYTEIIETGNWSLIDTERKVRLKILIPVFFEKNRISWRWK